MTFPGIERMLTLPIVSLALAAMFALMPALAAAQAEYTPIEQRLTAEQMHATGLDQLSAGQLSLLNQLLAQEQSKVRAEPADQRRRGAHREARAEVKEPLWHALISNLASVRPGGVTLCRDLSKGHPGYSQQETNEKILHCLEESKPMSCAKIQARGFECKKNCLVNSPAGLIFDIGCYDYSGDRTSDSRIKISFSERQGSVQQVAIS